MCLLARVAPVLDTCRLTFPLWADRAKPLLGLMGAAAPAYLAFLLYFGGSPKTTDVGYSPLQPIAFSHQVHAGQIGMDCRYCHTTVESAAFAAVPATSICMNCHTAIGADSEELAPLRESIETGVPLHWVRVHDLPDYVYFDHSAHVTRGVGCVSCHGRIDTMEQVYQVETLSMGWCLDCHRDPAPHLRPREFATHLGWANEQGFDEAGLREVGESIMQENGIRPSTDCSTCHR